MTQEEKSLLLQDLCARLPYGVECIHPKTGQVVEIKNLNLYAGIVDMIPAFKIEEVKPYLRPMSSMTEKEREEWADLFNLELDKLNEIDDENKAEELAPYYFGKSHQVSIDWLNKNMFDYRNLIPMGLALEAPSNMYKSE